uniref:Dolichol kinase n=1 Tax=Heterorhabditis bacteriophora TaxID=37862 RepID=A0A1I7XF50_HETBA
MFIILYFNDMTLLTLFINGALSALGALTCYNLIKEYIPIFIQRKMFGNDQCKVSNDPIPEPMGVICAAVYLIVMFVFIPFPFVEWVETELAFKVTIIYIYIYIYIYISLTTCCFIVKSLGCICVLYHVGMSTAVFKVSDLKLFGDIILKTFSVFGILYRRDFLKDDERWIEINNLTILNMILKFTGPLHEESLTNLLLFIQIICSCFAFFSKKNGYINGDLYCSSILHYITDHIEPASVT